MVKVRVGVDFKRTTNILVVSIYSREEPVQSLAGVLSVKGEFPFILFLPDNGDDVLQIF